MASFDSLPTEILFAIARDVGSANLRASPERLVICRPWYKVAQLVALESASFTAQNIASFLNAPTAAQSLLKSNIHSLTVDTSIFPLCSNLPNGNGIYGSSRHRLISTMYHSIIKFASDHVPEMTGLREFTFKFFLPFSVHEDYQALHNEAMYKLLASLPKSLEKLEVDNSGYLSRLALDFRVIPGYHICPLLLDESRLPNLKDLKLCVRNICPKLLDTTNSTKKHRRLETLAINLSLHQDSDPSIFDAGEARPCLRGGGLMSAFHFHDDYQDQNPNHLVPFNSTTTHSRHDTSSQMSAWATAVLPHLPNIKTLQVISQQRERRHTLGGTAGMGGMASINGLGGNMGSNTGMNLSGMAGMGMGIGGSSTFNAVDPNAFMDENTTSEGNNFGYDNFHGWRAPRMLVVSDFATGRIGSLGEGERWGDAKMDCMKAQRSQSAVGTEWAFAF